MDKLSTSQSVRPATREVLGILTASNQLTTTDEVFANFPGVKYFEVVVGEGKIVLTPICPDPLEDVWEQTSRLGITEQDVEDAVAWARKGGRQT